VYCRGFSSNLSIGSNRCSLPPNNTETPSKFDAKPKAKFVSGPVKRTKKPASKYGVAVCEDKYAVKSLNNIDESLGHK